MNTADPADSLLEMLTFADAERQLAGALDAYQVRPRQQALAAAIEDTLGGGGILLAEAGTGIGKSFAALIPAILSGRKTVIATATKMLQRQYIESDLPFLAQHLGADFTYAEIKGRSNYPCASRIADLAAPSAGQRALLAVVDGLSDGEVASRESLPLVEDREWYQLSISSSECPGAKDCPFGREGKCMVEKAKEKAAQSDIIITNLAYLATDLKLKAETGGAVNLLGRIDQLVLDEAHNLDSAISSALSDQVSAGTIARLSGDAQAMLMQHGADAEAAVRLGYYGQKLWEAVGTEFARWQKEQQRRRADSRQLPLPQEMRDAMLRPGFEAIAGSVTDVLLSLRFDADRDVQRRKDRIVRRLSSLRTRLRAYLDDPDDVTVRWVEEHDSKVMLASIPVSPAPFLRDRVWSEEFPVILMSATLAAGKDHSGKPDFSYPARTFGIPADRMTAFDAGSPFDYRSQALLFIPRADVPVPSGSTRNEWQGWAQATMSELVRESGGGALLLFTSRSAMDAAYGALQMTFGQMDLDIMKQGDAAPQVLVERFRRSGNGVIFGLRTFFEGVNIPGDALRLVVIDKLPFPVPSDLQFAAREEAVTSRGGNSFRQLSIPMMTWPLLQAMGRLLRHESDRGVVAILDPRLSIKSYGRDILRALPPARSTTDIREAAKFLGRSR